MKVSTERFFMGLAGLFVMVVIAAIVIQMLTEQRRGAARARLKLPAVLTQELKNLPPSQLSTGQNGPEPAGLPQSEPRDPSESAAAFADLFRHVEVFAKDERYKFLKRPPTEWNAEEQAQARELAKASRDVILEIRRLAELGGPALELDYSKGSAIKLPHLEPLRYCAKLLRIDAWVKSQQRNYGEVVEDILAELKLGKVVKDEHIFASQFVRIEMETMAFMSVVDDLPADRLSPESAERVIRTVGQMDSHQSFLDSLAGESACGLDTFDRLRDGNAEGFLGFLGPTSGVSDPGALRVLETVMGSSIARPLLNMDETVFTEALTRIQDVADLPTYQAEPAIGRIVGEGIAGGVRGTRLLTGILLSNFARAVDMQARDEALIALLQVGLALELYHTQHGTYPATLDAIAPTLGGRVPLDPYTGQPLHYRPAGQSFLLYSVGIDLADDGGQQGYTESGQLNFWQGDIVWRAGNRTHGR
ncbi:MAG: hypothetical protein HZB26_07765 [Candidatus Hydrogenedentes bacterium]|nr:hypothetical protein [Candidatus Hydrogenedentota bacterium]